MSWEAPAAVLVGDDRGLDQEDGENGQTQDMYVGGRTSETR